MALIETLFPLLMAGSLACSLTACSETAPESLERNTPSEDPVISMQLSSTEAGEESSSGIHLRNEQAPFACDVLDPTEVGSVLAEKVNVIDYTQDRQRDVPVESTCLLGYGAAAAKETFDIRLDYIRIDVYSDQALQTREWGTLNEQWQHRLLSSSGSVKLNEAGVQAVWVDSEHPPDPALLVRMGDIMFEIAYWPPSSSAGSTERNSKIETLANLVVKRVKETVVE